MLFSTSMMISRSYSFFLLLLVFIPIIEEIHGDYSVTCFNANSKCFLKWAPCPTECPFNSPTDPNAKVCTLNCNSPLCTSECRNQRPHCNGPGSACLDPRFTGGDGIVFYFHGKSNEHFSLVSDHNLQINARFIGLRPAGRPRDYTWIQALRILFDSHSFSVEATNATTWDDQVDHLKFFYDGIQLNIDRTHKSLWTSHDSKIKVQRGSSKNRALISIHEVADFSVNVIPLTKEDDRIHNYRISSDNCFAHLEVQFRFYALSLEVKGVRARTELIGLILSTRQSQALLCLFLEVKTGIEPLHFCPQTVNHAYSPQLK